uniref:Uncharacterized protein n=1 Tax=Meloidogyne floridensis TaxID=298350 RepID=A0A915NPL6_9BILA
MGSLNSKNGNNWRSDSEPCEHYKDSTVIEIWRNRTFCYGATHSIVVVKYKCNKCNEIFYKSYDFAREGERVNFGRPDKSKVIYAWKVHCTEGLTFSKVEELSSKVKTDVYYIFEQEKYALLKLNCHDWALGFERILRSQTKCNEKCTGCKKYDLEYLPLKIQTWIISDTVRLYPIFYPHYYAKNLITKCLLDFSRAFNFKANYITKTHYAKWK